MSERLAADVAPRRIGFATAVTLALLAVLILMALLGPLLVPYDPVATDPPAALQPPSAMHLFGTDSLGRDVFSRVVVSARVDLGIALIAVAVTVLIGTALGAAAGWAGGWTDRIVGRLMDTIMAFPLFVLAALVAWSRVYVGVHYPLDVAAGVGLSVSCTISVP